MEFDAQNELNKILQVISPALFASRKPGFAHIYIIYLRLGNMFLKMDEKVVVEKSDLDGFQSRISTVFAEMVEDMKTLVALRGSS